MFKNCFCFPISTMQNSIILFFVSQLSTTFFPTTPEIRIKLFRQQDGIVAEEKLEVAGDNFLDLFFDLKLNLGIECAGGSEEHGGNSLLFFQIKIHPSPFSKILKRERPDRQSFIMNEINIH